MSDVNCRNSDPRNEKVCHCPPGTCVAYGTDSNRVKVPGHPEHKGYLRAFPDNGRKT